MPAFFDDRSIPRQCSFKKLVEDSQSIDTSIIDRQMGTLSL
jgi:hypothetical protein